MALDPLQLGLEFGGGGVLGLLTGFAAKKVAKIIAFIIGAEIALLKFLETKGVLDVNWGALAGAAGNVTQAGVEAGTGTSGYLMSILSAIPVGGGFALGAFVGFKKG
ncbi:MAG: FUN14 domain-containing protein [Halobacteria archaeon]|nr:FUN14 domain-containing protein [Halobacteria archaeon]